MENIHHQERADTTELHTLNGYLGKFCYTLEIFEYKKLNNMPQVINSCIQWVNCVVCEL